MSEEEARDRGYWSLTRPYRPRQEYMWDKVLHDMERGEIPHALVKVTVEQTNGSYEGVEVWRGDK